MKIIFEKKPKKQRTLAEFSKKIIAALTAMWFLGAIFGFVVCMLQSIRGDMVNLSDLLLYIGAPMTGGILGYYLKAAIENKEKIKKGTNEYEETCNETDLP